MYQTAQDRQNQMQTRWTRKATSLIVIAGLLHMVSLPAQAAMQQERLNAQVKAQQNASTDDSVWEQLTELSASHAIKVEQLAYSRSIQKIEWYNALWQKVTSLFTDSAEEIAVREQTKQSIDSILALRTASMQEHTALMSELRDEAIALAQRHASLDQRQEHRGMIEELHARYTTLQGLFDQLQAAQDGSESIQQRALTAWQKQMTAWQPARVQPNMEQLPWGSPSAEVREPITAENSTDILPITLHNQQYNAAPLKNSSIGQWRSFEGAFQQYYFDQFPIQRTNNFSGMARNGDWPVLKSLPATVQPTDLTANEDVSISPEIEALAQELDHNPTKIYKWVYDNIEFIPTYGSIQGAAYTLETKRGNAFDTASLLIALLRTSDIPARYVYGTIEVPTAAVNDWVGGVNNADAAKNLMGQGGIPNVGLISNGQVEQIRLEHVWVEAYVDALPSRGSMPSPRESRATADELRMWMPLDASYKRYNRTAGIDLAKAVPFDAEGLVRELEASATIDENLGSVKNIDQEKLNQALTDYQQRVGDYLAQNHADATVGEVLGKQEIRPYASQMLSPLLPYQINTVVSNYHTLPDSMRHYFQVKLSDGSWADPSGDGSFDYKIPTTRLQGKPLALSFTPSTPADQERIESLLPQPDAEGNIDPASLPKTLPSNFSLSPQLSLDGQILATGQGHRIGTVFKAQMGFTSPNQNIALANKNIIVGGYYAVGYNLQGMSQQQLERLKTTLETSKAKIESAQENQIASLSNHDVVGAMLQSVVQSYFAIGDTQDAIAAVPAQVIKRPYMSFGTFSTSLQPVSSWGMLRQVSVSGLAMDINRLMAVAVHADNDRDALTAYHLASGMRMSANEHAVPEAFFNDPNSTQRQAEGVSAVKAIQLAAQQGQTIYQITSENAAQVLPLLTHKSDTIRDIQNAINAGKTVTTSQNPINLNGWVGTGYIVFDPTTGSGGYMINGGLNGGALDFFGSNANAFALILGIASVLATLGPVSLPIMLALIAVTFFVAAMVTMYNNLILIENGCPNATILLNSALNMFGFLIGVVAKGTGTAIVSAISTWLYNNVLPSAAPLCRYS